MTKTVIDNILQVGIVVKDIDKAIKTWENLYGIGPWEIMRVNDETAHDIKVYGKAVDNYDAILAMSKVGQMHVELIQPVSENSDYYFFLKDHGEGIHHLAVKHNDGFLRLIEERNIKELGSAVLGSTFCAYYDTKDDLGFVTETF